MKNKNKMKGTHQLLIRISHDLYSLLREESFLNNEPMNQIVNRLLEDKYYKK